MRRLLVISLLSIWPAAATKAVDIAATAELNASPSPMLQTRANPESVGSDRQSTAAEAHTASSTTQGGPAISSAGGPDEKNTIVTGTSGPEADAFRTGAGRTRGLPPEAIRPLLTSAATEHGLPTDFFTLLIRTESRFNPQAVSPVGAQGIAQFMLRTAAERGLADPFDPAQALPKSAELLKELRIRFGNLGLAAAAYNAGPRRVLDWLAGRGRLPLETQRYVRTVTGRSAHEWAAAKQDPPEPMPANDPNHPVAQAGVVNGQAVEAELKGSPLRPASTSNASPPTESSNVKMASAVSHHAVARKEKVATRQHSGRRATAVKVVASSSRSKAVAVAMDRLVPRYRVPDGFAPVAFRSGSPRRGDAGFHVGHAPDPRSGLHDLCSRVRASGGACASARNVLAQRKEAGPSIPHYRAAVSSAANTARDPS